MRSSGVSQKHPSRVMEKSVYVNTKERKAMLEKSFILPSNKKIQ